MSANETVQNPAAPAALPSKMPPKQIRNELRGRITPQRADWRPPAPGVSGGVAVTPLDATSSDGLAAGDLRTESLPVPAAFQEFPGAERRRTRNRMLALTGLFCAALAVVAAVPLWIGGVRFASMRGRLAEIERDLEDAQRALLAERAAGAPELARTAEGLATAMRKEIEKERADLAERGAALSEKVAVYDRMLGEMTQKLTELRSNNEALRQDIRSMKGQMVEIEASRSREVKAAAPAGAETTAATRAATAAAPASNTTFRPLELSFAPVGRDAPVRWRLPIRE